MKAIHPDQAHSTFSTQRCRLNRSLHSITQQTICFERRGANEKAAFWVALLYRDALRIIQGAAE